jgi:DNA repair ATPase RecN
MLELHVEDFRAVNNITLTVDGLVWITGPNSQGKSGLIKAIDALIRNSTGADFIQAGKEQTRVSLLSPQTDSFPALDVSWTKKRKGSGAYKINGIELVKTGSTTPQEILDSGLVFLRLKDRVFNLHVWDQATYFLVREPTTVIFQAISRLLKHRAFLPMLKQIKGDIKEKKTQVTDLGSQFKYLQKKEINLTVQIEFYQDFESRRDVFIQLEKQHKLLETAQQDYNFLLGLKRGILDVKEEVKEQDILLGQVQPLLTPIQNQMTLLKEANTLLKEYQNLEERMSQVDTDLINLPLEKITRMDRSELNQFTQGRRLLQDVRSIATEQQSVKDTLASIPEHLFEIQSRLKALYKVYDWAVDLEVEVGIIQEQLDDATQIRKKSDSDYEIALAQKEQFLKDNPLCPLCGNKWKEGEQKCQ